jgi:hypothetical protein
VKGYFWANLKGTIINWEVRRFRLYRNARPMDILWEGALETGAVDEIMLMVPLRSPHTEQAAKDAGEGGSGDPLKNDRPKYPEAFLTVTDGRHVKGAKYRLTGMSFLGVENGGALGPEDDPYVRQKGGSPMTGPAPEVYRILVSLDKLERTRAA